jgi:protein-export membrane protein SecD/preprotein translocase SecF subunit
MSAGIGKRLLVIAVIVIASLWTIYPPRETIRLGLDLAGGVHLVLRVKPAAPDRGQPPPAGGTADHIVDEALQTIERRVNALGVAEAVVARYTEHDQILVELPGVADVDQAKHVIASTAQLRLTLVDRGPFADAAAALQAYGGQLPATLDVLPGPTDTPGARPSAYYVVDRAAVVAGSDLRDARQSVDEFNQPAVHFTLKEEAARRFGAFTAQHVNRSLATVLDGRVTSVATILSRIDDQGQISGISHAEMIEQVITFKSGALPADLEYVEERTIGASLGEASIRAGVAASAGGLALVMLFMLAYYRLAGFNATVSIVLNLLILVALVAWIPVTMTLPGIAGLILTIGMGVDSNVLIFERIKEELGRARDPRSAVRAGFDRVWITIVDTHVTSLIAAAFLFQFGTSAIRGFATTLTIGLVANAFTAVFASRTMFELALRLRGPSGAAMGLGASGTGTPAGAVAVTRWGVPAMVLSLAIIAAGVVTVATRGVALGIDFSGGTLVIAEFAEAGVTEAAVREALSRLPGDPVVQRYGPAIERRLLIRVPLVEEADAGKALDASVGRVTGALEAANLPAFRVVERELVSAAIGADLQQRGLYATCASIVAIAIYIGIRFRWAFAIGALAATLHDVLVTLACLALAGYDLSLNVTAALLTVIGYSVNDTIVIFDRIRENARALAQQPLAAIVNLSVRQTLGRTVITAGTTLLSVASLYVFGGAALAGFAFTMLVGIISGTWSTVFVASAIATRLGTTGPGVQSGTARRAPRGDNGP